MVASCSAVASSSVADLAVVAGSAALQAISEGQGEVDSEEDLREGQGLVEATSMVLHAVDSAEAAAAAASAVRSATLDRVREPAAGAAMVHREVIRIDRGIEYSATVQRRAWALPQREVTLESKGARTGPWLLKKRAEQPDTQEQCPGSKKRSVQSPR